MKSFAFIALLAAVPLIVSGAAADPGSKIQDGQRATSTLLATARVSGPSVPDGMRFLFLVARKPETTGQFTLKETRDFLLAGESYQERTKADLGKQFEPSTAFDTAEGFFGKQPAMRGLAPDDIKGMYILTVSIGGTQLSAGATGEVTLNAGFDKQIEPFTFRFAIPPEPSGAPKP
jgi:hypothetical protein